MTLKKIPTIFISLIVLSSVIYASSCMKWLPLSDNDIVVVVPINKSNPFTTKEDLDCDGIIDSKDSDIDGDGIANVNDTFPRDPNENKDTDKDGIGDNKDRPVAYAQSLAFDSNISTHNITLRGNDDSSSVTFTLVSQPQHGTLTGTAPNLVYIPDSDYLGTDTFTYRVNDGSLDSSVVTVSINVFTTVKKKILVTQVSGNTASYNAIATFYVSIDEKPTADVVIPVISSDESEGVVDKDTLTFTPDNYNTPHRVIVKGRNSNVIDGVQNYKVELGVSQSADMTYDNIDVADVEMKGVYLNLNDVTDSTSFIAGLESTISMNTTYTGFDDLNYTLVQKPDGMVIDSKSGLISWTPVEADEGKSYGVTVAVSDGNLSDEISFDIYINTQIFLETVINNNILTIKTPSSCNFEGFHNMGNFSITVPIGKEYLLESIK